MNCHDIPTLIHAYVDGELDLVKNLEIEQHLRDCPACALVRQQQQALRSAFRSAALAYPAPAGLRNRIQAALRPAAPAHPARRALVWSWAGAGLAASLALNVFLLWWLFRPAGVAGDDFVARATLASHVRSLQQAEHHFVDVKSADQHAVKPWFKGKVDFAPDVQDFKKQGFPLQGGRLDYFAGHDVAVLVYLRRQHVINLFIWKPAGAESAPPNQTRRGYHLVSWQQAGLVYCAVSDLNLDELRHFVALVRGS